MFKSQKPKPVISFLLGFGSKEYSMITIWFMREDLNDLQQMLIWGMRRNHPMSILFLKFEIQFMHVDRVGIILF